MITRKRSYSSRSRSRSSGFYTPRRKNRSRSNERSKFSSSLKERNRQRSHSKNFDYSPRRSLSPIERKSKFSRLRKPEIQSSVNPITDFQTEGVRTTARDSHSPISLTERFTRLTNSGTAVYNKRRYGRFGDNHRLPHLILTNNTKLPPATLMRQAKEISIVIERTFPLNMDLSPHEKPVTFDFRHSHIIIPRRPNEGCKPVFDRPGLKFYNTEADEALIYKRLMDTISSSNSRRSNNTDNKKESEYHDISHFTGPGRFYGSRVDERLMDSKRTYPLDPSETPKGHSYYLHDDRTEDGYGPRRRWNNKSDRLYSSSYRRDRRSRPTSPSPRSSRSEIKPKKWLHDKFEEMEGDSSSQKPIPMPVPAPKPILWSTIGKEILNGNKTVVSDDQNYSPNSAANQSPLTDNENITNKLETKVQSVVSNSTVRSNENVCTKEEHLNSEIFHLDVDHVFDEAIER
uniref:Btz domain-containing protein n=1 Tax=Schistosoma mansoni TaxID=6183 RepID=A0A3Q0KJ22_SCHMA